MPADTDLSPKRDAAPVTAPLPDRFARWPLYSGIAVLSIVTATWFSPPSLAVPFLFMFGLPAMSAGLFGSMGVLLWCAPVALFRRRWRRALSMLALPLMVLLTLPSTEVARVVRDDLRFHFRKSEYDAQVARAQAGGKHYVVVDDWSTFVTDNTFIVWDEWDKPEEVMGFKPYHSFGGHYYKVSD